jgi:hypothetical protein
LPHSRTQDCTSPTLGIGLNAAMSEQVKPREKKPCRPSYEEGELRGESTEEKFDPSFRRKDLMGLIGKAPKKR